MGLVGDDVARGRIEARLTTAAGTLLDDRTVTAVGTYGVKALVTPSSPWIIQMVASGT